MFWVKLSLFFIPNVYIIHSQLDEMSSAIEFLFLCSCIFTRYRLFFLRSIAQFFYTDLHELFCQFISWTNWVKSGKISCQAVTDMENFHDNLIIINLYFIHFNNEMIHRIDDSFVKKNRLHKNKNFTTERISPNLSML